MQGGKGLNATAIAVTAVLGGPAVGFIVAVTIVIVGGGAAYIGSSTAAASAGRRL